MADADPVPVSLTPPIEPPIAPGEKVKQFPAAPGVYLMKDTQGRVVYVGKAKNLRNRAAHYFSKAAAEETQVPKAKAKAGSPGARRRI